MPELRVPLPASPLAPRHARDAIRSQLAAWSLERTADDVLLLVSELVTNAIHYGRSRIELSVAWREGVIRVEVHDASPALPVREAMSNDALRGRGMGIVAAVAARWGVDPVPGDGKTVWFELVP